jgi:outer membrane protein assembly factor BamB
MKMLQFTWLALFMFVQAGQAENWPRFRGPNGTGISHDKGVPVEWSEQDILWKCPLPGSGHSSPIVWGDKIFLQTASGDGKDRRLVCVSAADGKVVWSTPVRGKLGVTHPKNSLASGTPAADGKQVYALFWDGQDLEAVAFDFAGTLVWKKDLGRFTSQHGAGHSPIVHDGKVIFADDQDGSARLFALNASDGSEAWSKDRTAYRACYSTPFLIERSDGTVDLIVGSTDGVTSYDPKNGSVHWKYTWKFDNKPLRTVASPIFTQDMIFACSGDGDGSRHAIAIKADGKDDVTRTALVWENKKSLPYVPTLLAKGEHIYSVSDKGIAGCYLARTGEEVWTARLAGGDVSASPIMIDGKIYAVNEKGDVYVFAAASRFEQLARNTVGEGVSATPAVADGKLFIRGKEHLFCIGKGN